MERNDRVAQLRKGVLELAILAILDRGESYGGEIVEHLAAHAGLAANAGTVYPLLARLKRSGALETTWRESPVGPPRKYYRLSRAGRTHLHDAARTWRDLASAMHDLLKDVTP